MIENIGFGLSTSESWFCDEREDTSDTITTALIGEVCCVFWFDLFDALLVNLKLATRQAFGVPVRANTQRFAEEESWMLLRHSLAD